MRKQKLPYSFLSTAKPLLFETAVYDYTHRAFISQEIHILGYLTISTEVYFFRSTRHFESENIYFLLHKFQLFIHSLIRACACSDLETKKNAG